MKPHMSLFPTGSNRLPYLVHILIFIQIMPISSKEFSAENSPKSSAEKRIEKISTALLTIGDCFCHIADDQKKSARKEHAKKGLRDKKNQTARRFCTKIVCSTFFPEIVF